MTQHIPIYLCELRGDGIYCQQWDGTKGCLCLTLCPTSDHPKSTGDTSKPSKRLSGGSAAPARATSVGKMSRALRKEVAPSEQGPKIPTASSQPPPGTQGTVTGECFGGEAASQHPSQEQKRLNPAPSSAGPWQHSHHSPPAPATAARQELRVQPGSAAPCARQIAHLQGRSSPPLSPYPPPVSLWDSSGVTLQRKRWHRDF